MCECGFHILRMHVETGGGHDEIALATGEDQLTRRIAGGKVAGMQPALLGGACLGLSGTPFSVGDGLATYQDLAIVGDANLAPGKRLADAAACGVEGMIERDERGGLGHPV